MIRLYKVLCVPKSVLPDVEATVIFKRAGFEHRTEESAIEALAAVRHWQPDLVIIGALEGSSLAGFCASVRTLATRETKLLVLCRPEDDLTGLGDAGSHVRLAVPASVAVISDTVATMLELKLRRAPRVPVDLIAEVHGLAEDPQEDGPSLPGNIIDLSETGLLLEAPTRLALGKIGTIHFFLPGTTERLSPRCVVRCLRDEQLLHYGLEFSNLQPNIKDRLRAFVGRGQESPDSES